MRTLSLFITLLLFPCTVIIAQIPDSVHSYIDSALYLMKTKSLYAKSLDWKTIKDSAFYKARGARTYKEAFGAIAYAFQQLKDYHGMVANQDTFYRYPPPVNFDEVLSPGIKKEFLKGPRIVTDFLDNSVAYLRVPTMNVTRQQDIDDKANKLRDSLCVLITKSPKGIIIDLRMNSGGNSAPMISGLGPLFHTSLLGYGVDRDGKLLEAVKVKDGVLTDENGKKLTTIKNSCSIKKSVPIAVLIGPSTVSSAEILAVYLKGQPNVRIFGEPTPGFCNATEGFLFMNNEGYLLLTVNKIADSKKHVYEGMRVHPDVYIKGNDNYDDLKKDPIVKEAWKWVSGN